MASNDLKNSFAERIKKRKESMTQAKAVEDSNSSTTQAAKTKSETKTAKSETQASFEDRITKRRSKLGMDTEVDDSFISSFISDANAYLNNAHSSYNSLGYSNAASTYDSTVDSVVGLRSRYGAITRYLKNNKDQLDPGYYDELSSNLETFIQSLNQYQKTFYDAKNFYAQWDSEEEYTAYLAEEEERAQRLAKLTGGYDPAKNRQEGKAGWEKYLADKEAESKAEEDKTWWEKIAESYAYSSADTSLPAASLSNVTNMYRNDTTYREPDERWSEEQRNIYGYLYSQNPNKAWDYAIEINNTLNAKEQNKAKEKVTESATGSVGSGAAHTFGALLTAPLGLADYLDNLAELAGRGTITQKGGDVLTPFDYSQTVTGGISQELNEKYGTLNQNIPVIGGKGWGDAYGLGMSFAQSTMAAYTGGSTGALVQFFGSAAAAGVDDALSRGATADQAMLFGTMEGLAEGLAESIGVDNLFKIGSANTMRQLVANILKQGAAEGLEEGITSILNEFSDRLVMGDKSNFMARVAQYMASGMSEGDAKKQAWLDFAEDTAFDMLGGFATGFASGTLQTGIQTIDANKQAKQIYGSDPGALVSEALEIDPDNAFAQKMQGRVDSGKGLSGGQLNRLVEQNEAAMTAQDMQSIQAAAAQRLTELGETGDVDAIAVALAKRFSGQELTRKENQLIQNSQYGRRVSTEMNPENIRSGGYASGWAESIGTHRINAQEYGRMLQAAQSQQKAAETTGEQVAAEAQNDAQAPQVEPKVATVAENATVKESLQVAEEISDAQEISDDGVTRQKSTGEEITPKKIVSIEGGKVMIQTDSGTVEADDIEFGTGDMALLWHSATQFHGINASGANGVIWAYHGQQPVATYLHGAAQEFRNGYYNMESGGEHANKLTPAQREIIYELGQKAAGEIVAKAQAKATEAKKKKATDSKTERVGKVHFDRNGRTFDQKRETSLKTMEQLSKALGVEFYVYESYVNEAGKRVYKDANGNENHAPNGWFDPSDGSIHIDLNAGADGKGTMLFTVSHELTHFIREWSPAKFKVLANFLITQYGETDVSVNELVEAQIKKAKKNGRDISYDTAFEEVVADSMEAIMTDGNVVQFMAELKQQDKTLWQKICDWFKDLVNDLKAIVEAYKGYKPDSNEGRLVADMQDMITVLESLYAEALVDAGENFQAEKAEKNTTREGGAKLSIRETLDGRFVAVVESDILQDIDTSGWNQEKKRKAQAAASEALKQFSDGIVVNGVTRAVNRTSRREYTRSKDTARLYRDNTEAFADKMRAADVADDIVIAATDWNRDGGLNHPRTDDFVDFDHGQTLIMSGTAKYSAEVVVGITSDGAAVFYDVVDMTPTDFEMKNAEPHSTATTNKSIGDMIGGSAGSNVAQPDVEVKEKFSLREPVEYTKNLVALHNLTEDKLTKALDLGGFPMPSIAVTKADIPHTNFGEITLVFGRETIDPKANKKNVVYSADAWTPTFPQVEYEADSEVGYRINHRLNDLGKKMDDFFRDDLNRLKYSYEDNLNRYGGEDGLVQHAMENYGLKAAYLEEQGKHIEKITTRQEAEKDFNPQNADKYMKIMDILGVTTAEEIGKVNLKDARDNHGAELEAIYPGMTKTAMRMGRLFNAVKSYLEYKDAGPIYTTVTDYNATRKAVDEALDAEGFEAWTRNLFRGIQKSSGIYNNKEIFTPSGNRRSFKQTHMSVTLDNIVKAMAGQNGGSTKNVSGFNGIKTLRAGTAERFKSIEAMHQREGRLQNLTQEQLEEINDALGSRMYAIIEAIDKENGQQGDRNSLFRFDSIGDNLMEISEGGKYNVADIQRVFQKYGKEISDDTALEVKQLLYDVSQMPVNIFEAKPERSVRFDEVKAAILPKGTSQSVVNGLQQNGVPVQFYENGNDAERLQLVNAMESVKFSYRDSDYMDAVNRGDMKAAQRMVDAAAERWGAYRNNDEANEVFHQDGRLRIFYHGTNTGEFTTFDSRLLGSSSGDLGWFGKGFYFAFSHDEAATYGGRVIPAYLRMRNPYDYSQLYKFKGSDKGATEYARFAWVYNITTQFPDIAEGQRVWAYPNDAEEGSAVSWKQLTTWMDRIQKEKQFSVEEVELSDGTTAWKLRADPKKESFTNEDGETFEWTEYGMEQIFATEQDANEPINQIGAYLKNVMGVDSIPRRAIEKIDFSGALQRAGYDGILQSMSGDEAVVFLPEQIKISEPVTFDDNGNVIPLSKRFSPENKDIRYSERDPELEKVNRVLQKENTELRHDVAYLKELLKLQKQVTGGTKFTKSSVEAAAGHLMKYAGAKGDKSELVPLLNGVYEYIAGNKELTWEGIKETAQPAVQWLRDHVRTRTERSAYANDVLKEIRNSRIYLDEQQKKEVAYQYGSYNEFRKKTMGSVILTDRDAISLDSQWHEWANLYPNLFDPDISSNDMPAALMDVFDSLRNMTETDDYSYDQELFSQELLSQVYDSYWNVSTLYTVADKAQKEINRLKFDHIGRMNTLKNYHKEQTAKLKQEHREDLKRVRQEMRDREEAKLKKIQEQHRESKEKGAERRSKAEMRRKIRRTVMDLNKILNKGDKKRNVKEDMKDLVSEALRSADILFMDNYSNEDMVRNGVGTDMTEQEAKYMAEAQSILAEIEGAGTAQERQEAENRLQGKLDYRMGKLKDVFLREKARINKATVSDVLGSLADAYKSLDDSEYDYVKGAFDENVYQYLTALKGKVGGTIVKDMSLYQLEELHKAYTMVLTTVRNANKMFAANLKQTREQLGSQTIAEVQKAGGEHGLWAPGEDKISTFFWNNQKPVYAFERIGSETLKTLFENTRAGEDSWIQDMTEAREYYLAQIRKHKYDSWDFEKQYKFTSTSGIDFSLNLEQIMSLYAYSKREQAHDHLMKGGFVFDGNTEVQVSKMGVKMTYLNKTAKAHNVSPEILGDIVSKLTAEQKAFVDEMQDYLSTNMGGKGNEVSMQMYGVKLFNEKYYFPLRSAGQYMERAKEADLKKQQGQISIVNSGFTKATTPKSSNPVVLSGFMDVWADHVNEMSMYHSFVLPMEDFRRVYNYSSPNMETGRSISVNSVIQDAYGEAATGYIDQLYRDLNGGAVSDPRETPAKALMGKFKKAAVFASMSVVIQQPSAIGRAFAIIDPKYFIGGKVDHKRHKALWAELKKYAPVAAIKEMGYFDTGMGKSAQDFIKAKEYHGLKEKAAALITDGDYRDEVLGKAPALADELTWCAIWEAAKRETKAKNPKMDVKSEAFLQEAGKRFTEVITKTQVYDSVLSRSANMRSKGAFMNMWTAFMAEPTTTINMVEDALRKGKRGDKKYAAKAMGAVMTSVVINSVLVSLVYAMRDDDEDETFLEKYVQSFATEILDGINPITYYPFLKDIWSALQGFDIERADMSLITSLVEKFTKAVQVCGKDTDGMDEDELAAHNKELANAWWGVVDYATALAGIPVKNVRRDINGAVNMIHTISQDLTDRDTSWGILIDKTWDDVKNTIPVVGWMPEATAADKLYKATVNGDTAYQKRLASSYKTENSLNNAIRKGLRANDSRIWEAAMAWNNNDLEGYKRIAKGIVAEGHFSQDNVVMAIQAEANAMLPKESESGTKAKGYFTAEKFAVAISQGNDQMAAIIKADLIETAQKNGKTAEEAEKSFASSAKSDLEELFVAKDINESDAIAALTTYCDYEQDDATETVTKWRAEKENGIAYDDIKDEYLDGNMTEARAIEMYVRYGGYTQDDAAETVTKWRAEKETGIAYDDIKDAFMDGEISEADARNMYTTYGGFSEEEATKKAATLAFVKQNPKCDGISYDAVENYQTYCEDSGVPAETYYDAWKYNSGTKADVDANGKSISGSKKTKVLAYINTLDLTCAQKDSLYYAFGWAKSTISDAPWH